MKKINIDMEKLEKLYLEENYTQRQLAEYFNVGVKLINSRLKERNITKQLITKKLLEEEWLSGKYTTQQIADRYNCSRAKIEYHIKKHKLKKPTKLEIHRDKVIELFNQGNSYYAISNTLQCSLSTIYTILEKEGLKLETKKYDKYSKEELYNYYVVKNYTLQQIANKYNTSVTDINRYIKHYNITKNIKHDVDKIKYLYLEKNKKQYEIAEILGIKLTTLQGIMKRNNIVKDSSNFPIGKLRELVKKDLTIEEIADTLGYSRTYTGQVITSLKLQRGYTGQETSIEKAIREILDSHSIKYEQFNRDVIAPKELDFYLYEHDIAIEVTGLYWHSTAINKNKKHIVEKYNKCKNTNVRLLTIFEDEIVNRAEIVENRLLTILSKQPTICYARNTEIRHISSKDGIDFLNKHHIQGSGANSVYLGAYYNDQLVAVMAFSKPSIAKGKAKVDYELNRFAVQGNIPGIASKLFKKFVKKYNPSSIISYADLRWNTGNLYEVLGFTFSHSTEPNYWYIQGLERKSRFSYTKHKLQKLVDSIGNETEEELAAKLGLYRIYDCGNNVYIWNKS